jgi:hypothetical protein
VAFHTFGCRAYQAAEKGCGWEDVH